MTPRMVRGDVTFHLKFALQMAHPYNIFATAGARDFKFGTQLIGLPTPIIKQHPEEKWAWPWAREAPKYLLFPFNIFATAALSS